MVQHFTELGLRINSARVSSDGGWFVDGEPTCLCCRLPRCCCDTNAGHWLATGVPPPLACRQLAAACRASACVPPHPPPPFTGCPVFYLCEASGEKVRNPKKIYSIKQMLNVYMQQDDELAVNGGAGGGRSECDASAPPAAAAPVQQ